MVVGRKLLDAGVACHWASRLDVERGWSAGRRLESAGGAGGAEDC